MTPYSEADTEILICVLTLEVSLTYLIVAVVFGVVNTVIGNTIRVVAFPILHPDTRADCPLGQRADAADCEPGLHMVCVSYSLRG
jgi:hypothetical protein